MELRLGAVSPLRASCVKLLVYSSDFFRTVLLTLACSCPGGASPSGQHLPKWLMVRYYSPRLLMCQTILATLKIAGGRKVGSQVVNLLCFPTIIVARPFKGNSQLNLSIAPGRLHMLFESEHDLLIQKLKGSQ